MYYKEKIEIIKQTRLFYEYLPDCYAVCLCSFTKHVGLKSEGTLHIMSPAQKVGVMSPLSLSRELHPC